MWSLPGSTPPLPQVPEAGAPLAGIDAEMVGAGKTKIREPVFPKLRDLFLYRLN